MLRGLELRILVVVVVLASLGFAHRVYSQPLNAVCIDAERVELGEGLDAVVAGSTSDGAAEDPENNDIAAAGCSVVVCQNLNQYLTNAVTWQ